MSRPYLARQSLAAVILSGIGSVGVCQSPVTHEAVGNEANSYAIDHFDTRYTQTGLIRILEDNPSTAERSTESSATASPDNIGSGKNSITLTPLSTPNTSVQGIGTGVRPTDVTVDRLPPSQPLPVGDSRIGDWGMTTKPWVPGGFCHQPLYFEDPMLERHGHVRFPVLQPVASGFRFFGTVATLPYLATLRHPLDDVHTLGAYQPGTAAPVLRYRAHYDSVALRNQFIATAGTAVAVP